MALGDGFANVYLADGQHDVIGTDGTGVAADERNIISGGNGGVELAGSCDHQQHHRWQLHRHRRDRDSSSGNSVGVFVVNSGGDNQIGTDAAGTTACGAERDFRQPIRESMSLGTNEAGSNVIAGNYIGTNATGVWSCRIKAGASSSPTAAARMSSPGT